VILALAGGVGGAKLAHGLAMQVPPEELLIVVNTGDDFVHLGLNISPDLDTVMYWLAGINDTARGWGLAGESWNFMASLEKLGGPTWFMLGDRDLATHFERTQRLSRGERLSDVTAHLCKQLGIRHRIVPMTDEKVRTIVHTSEGALEFQHYFVRRQCEPQVLRLEFEGAQSVSPSPAFRAALAREDLAAIVICPSNPLLSVEPILAVKDVRASIQSHHAPVISVSPIVGGRAIKGPAAKIFRELGREASAFGIAQYYSGLIDGLVIDNIDAHLKQPIEALGLRVTVTNTVMKTSQDQARLANQVVALAARISESLHA
jgi:LPPG:FO 2-phospho-L-lactate transferase